MYQKFKLLTRVLAVACLGGVIGCSNAPYELVSISGIVTLDGAPLSNATVSFEPNGAGKQIVGPGSIGITNEEGAYELKTFKDEMGAVVGFHTVRISTFKSEFKDLKNSDEIKIVSEERVPAQFNRYTQLTFQVPPDGSSEANFALTASSPRTANN